LIAAPASSSLSPDWAELAQSRFEMLYYYLQMAARCAEKNLRDIGKRPSIILLKQLTLGNGACGAIRRAERRRKSSTSKNIVGAGGALLSCAKNCFGMPIPRRIELVQPIRESGLIMNASS
jgi:hypothetical protein